MSVGIVLSFLSAVFTIIAVFLFRSYVKIKRERALAYALNNRKKGSKKILRCIELLERDKISLERVIQGIERRHLLRLFERADTREEIFSAIRRWFGLDVKRRSKGGFKSRIDKRAKNEIIKKIIKNKLGEQVRYSARLKSIGGVKNIYELIGVMDKLDDEEVSKILDEYLKDKKRARERLIGNKEVRDILDKSLSKKDVIKLAREFLSDRVKSRYKDSKSNISALRKKGGDVTMAELKIIKVPARIKMFELTGETENLEKANLILDEVDDELIKA